MWGIARTVARERSDEPATLPMLENASIVPPRDAGPVTTAVPDEQPEMYLHCVGEVYGAGVRLAFREVVEDVRSPLARFGIVVELDQVRPGTITPDVIEETYRVLLRIPDIEVQRRVPDFMTVPRKSNSIFYIPTDEKGTAAILSSIGDEYTRQGVRLQERAIILPMYPEEVLSSGTSFEDVSAWIEWLKNSIDLPNPEAVWPQIELSAFQAIGLVDGDEETIQESVKEFGQRIESLPTRSARALEPVHLVQLGSSFGEFAKDVQQAWVKEWVNEGWLDEEAS